MDGVVEAVAVRAVQSDEDGQTYARQDMTPVESGRWIHDQSGHQMNR